MASKAESSRQTGFCDAELETGKAVLAGGARAVVWLPAPLAAMCSTMSGLVGRGATRAGCPQCMIRQSQSFFVKIQRTTARRGSALATKAVKAQGKGSVLAALYWSATLPTAGIILAILERLEQETHMGAKKPSGKKP